MRKKIIAVIIAITAVPLAFFGSALFNLYLLVKADENQVFSNVVQALKVDGSLSNVVLFGGLAFLVVISPLILKKIQHGCARLREKAIKSIKKFIKDVMSE